jgi:hypothetical protein
VEEREGPEPGPAPAEQEGEPSGTVGGPPKGEGVRTTLLLAAAAMVAAVLGGRASLVSSMASGAWQQAVRQEVQRSAALVEDVRFVYSGEAVTAFLVVEGRVRAEELMEQAESLTGRDREMLLIEAEAWQLLADNVGAGTDLVDDPKYQSEDGGYDLGLRLVDVRNRYPDLVAVNPDDPQQQGDDAAKRARLGVAATIPVAGAFLFGALAQGFPRRRRPLVAVGVLLLAAGIAAGVLVETVVT